MTLLAKVISRAWDEAKGPTASAERKAELEAWLKGHEAENTARIQVSSTHQSRSIEQRAGTSGSNTAANDREMDWALAQRPMGARLTRSRIELIGRTEACDVPWYDQGPRGRRGAQ